MFAYSPLAVAISSVLGTSLPTLPKTEILCFCECCGEYFYL